MLWRRHPNNPIGMLLLVAGLTGMAQYLVLFTNSAAFVVGLVAQELPAAAVAHAVLTFPDGRLRTRAERTFVPAVYGLPVLLQLAATLSVHVGARRPTRNLHVGVRRCCPGA